MSSGENNKQTKRLRMVISCAIKCSGGRTSSDTFLCFRWFKMWLGQIDKQTCFSVAFDFCFCLLSVLYPT